MKKFSKRYVRSICFILIAFFLFGNTLSFTISATTICGDVDDSGTVDISDVVLLSEYLSGELLSNSINMINADVDKNTVIDVNDVKTIQRYIALFISSLPYSESGITFDYDDYDIPVDEERNYVKYNCSTGNIINYTLPLPSRSGTIDDRILDSSSNAQCIVYLQYKGSDDNYYRGSGFIIDDHVIATCGHCLYDTASDEFHTNYTVKVYNAAGTSVVGTYWPDELHIPTAYKNSPFPTSNYDYGLIHVSGDLSQYGKMALGITTNNFEYTAQTVYVSGFPVNVYGDYDNDVFARYYGSGVVTTNTNNYKIWYTSYTSPGDSGGPVFMEYTLGNQTFRSAIGIATNSNGTNHWGNRITLPLLRFYCNNPNIG